MLRWGWAVLAIWIIAAILGVVTAGLVVLVLDSVLYLYLRPTRALLEEKAKMSDSDFR